ncbi:MAG: hypothetical protein EAZ92_11200 [Candidatus Kapaibacterium sp.]|nr:MAG: hypothetical protein EAZ92_11200 [Candidatus Kapabacteria bacterium]
MCLVLSIFVSKSCMIPYLYGLKKTVSKPHHSTKDVQAYLCALALQDSGREAAIIERLESHRKAGKINERTFYRLKASLRSYRSNKSLTQPNERLEELDRHVKREVQYYR